MDPSHDVGVGAGVKPATYGYAAHVIVMHQPTNSSYTVSASCCAIPLYCSFAYISNLATIILLHRYLTQ